AQQVRVVVGAWNMVEDRIEGVVLFGDEDHVLNLFGDLAWYRRDHRRGEHGTVSAAIHHAVVSERLCRVAGQFLRGRNRDDREYATHVYKRVLGNVRSGVGAVTEAFEADGEQLLAVVGEG